MSDNIAITLSQEEALVLFEFFSRFAETDQFQLQHNAEYQAFSSIAASLEKRLVEPFSPNYLELLKAARNKLADNGETLAPGVKMINYELFRPFDFSPPKAYFSVLERDLIRYDRGGSFSPWYYLNAEDIFELNHLQLNGPKNQRIIAFAQRQDTKELCGFEVVGNAVIGLVTFRKNYYRGGDMLVRYENFWIWIKSIIDNIQKLEEIMKPD